MQRGSLLALLFRLVRFHCYTGSQAFLYTATSWASTHVSSGECDRWESEEESRFYLGSLLFGNGICLCCKQRERLISCSYRTFREFRGLNVLSIGTCAATYPRELPSKNIIVLWVNVYSYIIFSARLTQTPRESFRFLERVFLFNERFNVFKRSAQFPHRRKTGRNSASGANGKKFRGKFTGAAEKEVRRGKKAEKGNVREKNFRKMC